MSVITPFNPLSAYGYSLGTGISQGLDELAKNKVKNIQQQKMQQLFQQNNYDAPTSQLLAQLYQGNPEQFYKILGQLGGQQQQQQPDIQQNAPGQEQAGPQPISFQQALSSNPKQNEASEKQKEKLRPIAEGINSSKETLLELKRLLENGDVKLGAYTDLVRSIPKYGNKLLNEDTGAFDALSNKYAVQKLSLLPGQKGKAQQEAIERAKTSLNRTKEQNLKIIEHELKEINNSERLFKKNYPSMSELFLNGKDENDNTIQNILSSSNSKNQQLPANLPPLNKYKEGDIVRNKKDNISIVKRNGTWEVYNG